MLLPQTYAATMHTLLAGNIIDEYSHPELYRTLQNEENRRLITDNLRQLDRELCTTNTQSGYYLAYLNAPTKTERDQLRDQFNHFAGQIAPLVEWLRLTRALNTDNRPLQAGDRLSQAELLTQIEQNTPLEAQLKDIARAFGSTTTLPKDQLNSILEKLKNQGYLIPYGTSGAVYHATAKWDLFYEQLEYLQNAASIPLPNTPETTQNTLL